MEDRITKLSRIERYMLSNQLKILEALYPQEANDFAVAREAFERGYEMLYEWNLEHIYGEGEIVSVREAREIWKTLDLFDALNRYMKENNISNPSAEFQGYDGNNEGKFMSFTAYTMERLGRFQYVKLPGDKYYNSHRPMREVYKRMVSEWENIPSERQFNLNETDFDHIINAKINPI